MKMLKIGNLTEMKNKMEMKRAENRGWENGKVLALCTAIEYLHVNLGWNDVKMAVFSKSLLEQLKTSKQEVLECAIKPWQEKLNASIDNKAEKNRHFYAETGIKSYEYNTRNISYLTYGSYILLNLYSNFNLGSNNGNGKLDNLIEFYTERFYDFMKDGKKYTTKRILRETKFKTGIEVM